MCNCQEHTIQVNVNNYDPTRTTTLRNAFVSQMNKRFDKLAADIGKAIVGDDVFNLITPKTNLAINASPGYHAFDFPTSSAKVEAFMRWVNRQIDNGVLQVNNFAQIGTSIDAAWTNMYIYNGYSRGVNRARQEMIKAGYKIPTIEETGGLRVVMSDMTHMDRVGVAYLRAFNGLKNITTTMDAQISTVLAEALANGDGAYLTARKIRAVIKGGGAELGIYDTLGRFIPAKRRAEMLARTEIIRAHHLGTIQEYENWGAAGVKVKAEWSTAGDDRVCEQCAGYDGNVYTLEEVRNMIPVHPNCRCMALPTEPIEK